MQDTPSITSPAVLRHIVDCHAHPTDSTISPEALDNLAIKICAMATTKQDQKLVYDLAAKNTQKIIPCFGYHPWFVHHIAISPITSKEKHYMDLISPIAEDLEAFQRLLPTLPDPIPLDDIISELSSNLLSFPNAMLGEVGMDRAARIPYDYHSSPRELTPFHVPFGHQMTILEAQLHLAVELKRNVSVHSVKAQQATLDLLNRMSKKYGDAWLEISVDIHSCSLSPQMWKDIEKKHLNVFLSLSTVINGRSSNHRHLISSASSHRLLVESDHNNIALSTQYTIEMLKTIAEVKGWTVEEEWVDDLPESEWGAVRKLEANWNVFCAGKHNLPNPSRNKRFNQDWIDDSDDSMEEFERDTKLMEQQVYY